MSTVSKSVREILIGRLGWYNLRRDDILIMENRSSRTGGNDRMKGSDNDTMNKEMAQNVEE